MGDSLALCQALAHVTRTITFGTSIMPIYFRQKSILRARQRSFTKFQAAVGFGIGVSLPGTEIEGDCCGKPLSDMRQFVSNF